MYNSVESRVICTYDSRRRYTSDKLSQLTTDTPRGDRQLAARLRAQKTSQGRKKIQPDLISDPSNRELNNALPVFFAGACSFVLNKIKLAIRFKCICY